MALPTHAQKLDTTCVRIEGFQLKNNLAITFASYTFFQNFVKRSFTLVILAGSTSESLQGNPTSLLPAINKFVTYFVANVRALSERKISLGSGFFMSC